MISKLALSNVAYRLRKARMRIRTHWMKIRCKGHLSLTNSRLEKPTDGDRAASDAQFAGFEPRLPTPQYTQWSRWTGKPNRGWPEMQTTTAALLVRLFLPLVDITGIPSDSLSLKLQRSSNILWIKVKYKQSITIYCAPKKLTKERTAPFLHLMQRWI